MITFAAGVVGARAGGGLQMAEPLGIRTSMRTRSGALVGEPGEHLLAAGGGLDAVDTGDTGHELAIFLVYDAVVVADQDGGHGVSSNLNGDEGVRPGAGR